MSFLMSGLDLVNVSVLEDLRLSDLHSPCNPFAYVQSPR